MTHSQNLPRSPSRPATWPKAIAFYRDVLGLKLMFEVSGMAFFDAGGIRLMIGPAHHQGDLQNNTYVYFDAGDWDRT